MEQLASPQPDQRDPDRSTRQAALWATLVAVPLSLLVAALLFARLTPDPPESPGSSGSLGDDGGRPAATATATAQPRSTAPVELAAPPLAERPATVCRALLSRLPATVGDLAQRPVTAGAEQNAGYGDPALTVRCGVSPAEAAPTDDVWTVNSVCWHAARKPEAMVFTTVDREVPVRVSVPREYEPALQWVAPIAAAVVASVPSAPAPSVPSGCTP